MRVRFFGDFAVHVDEQPVGRLRTGKVARLFQYLLLNQGITIRREKLSEVLWPAREWSPTDSSLKVAVHSLRRVVKDAAAGAGGVPPVEIVSQDRGYVLRARDVRSDVDEFDESMTAGRTAEGSGDLQRALACYRQATEVYRGDLLASETSDWITAARERDRALVLYALGCLRGDALRRESHPEVITHCHRILDLDPYHEETYQALMLAHGRRGELEQVRHWQRLCVRRLHEDLDVAPGETTRRIYARAVRGELRAELLSA